MNGHQTDTKNISIKYLEKILNSYQEREKHTQKYAPKYLKNIYHVKNSDEEKLSGSQEIK